MKEAPEGEKIAASGMNMERVAINDYGEAFGEEEGVGAASPFR